MKMIQKKTKKYRTWLATIEYAKGSILKAVNDVYPIENVTADIIMKQQPTNFLNEPPDLGCGSITSS